MWKWRAPQHINALEIEISLALYKALTLDGGDLRFPIITDSAVVLGSHTKGRSSARALLGVLYGPTRLNATTLPETLTCDLLCLAPCRLTLLQRAACPFFFPKALKASCKLAPAHSLARLRDGTSRQPAEPRLSPQRLPYASVVLGSPAELGFRSLQDSGTSSPVVPTSLSSFMGEMTLARCSPTNGRPSTTFVLWFPSIATVGAGYVDPAARFPCPVPGTVAWRCCYCTMWLLLPRLCRILPRLRCVLPLLQPLRRLHHLRLLHWFFLLYHRLRSLGLIRFAPALLPQCAQLARTLQSLIRSVQQLLWVTCCVLACPVPPLTCTSTTTAATLLCCHSQISP